ncbi:MAG: DUF819 family protein [Rhodothermales bacterium]|nr:DUF819 family protein [Rhodothermales bacterium]
MPFSPGDPLITDPTSIFALLAGILAAVFWLSGLDQFRRLFDVLPPVIWAYFVPMIATTIGILPDASPAYSWISRYLLPLSLFLLMVTIDLPAVLHLGKLAIIMMLAGTVGIVIGGPIAFLVFGQFLPVDAWKGLAALSGSWIGGTANMVAIQKSVGAADAALGPIIVVDTVVGYGWMGILLFLGSFQKRFDAWIGADTSALEEANQHLQEIEVKRKPIMMSHLGMILGLGFVATVISISIGQMLPDLGEPSVISKTTWAVLVVVTLGLVLSFTPIRRLEVYGASKVGYIALYLLMASIGARANLAAVLDAPLYLLTGLVWISIHVAILLAAARIFRAPLFLVATGSMANVGGAASAPVVAGAYMPSMAPVGLLMGVSGYILGIYAALGCAWILGQLSLLL